MSSEPLCADDVPSWCRKLHRVTRSVEGGEGEGSACCEFSSLHGARGAEEGDGAACSVP